MSLNGYVGNAQDAARIRRLEEKRLKEKADFEALKAGSASRGGESRLVGFASSNVEYVEHAFKQDTIGLQTKAQFAEKRANIEKELERERARARGEAEEAELRELSRKRAAAKAAATARLSFAVDDEAADDGDGEDDEDGAGKAKAADDDRAGGAAEPGDAAEAPSTKRLKFGSVGKNPAVATSFLPDRDREREERLERERLKEAWTAEQSALKAQPLEITYSYWDGAGHRRSIIVRKGDTIGAFLRAVRDALAPEFRELKSASADQMLYVKEDLIMPHSLTFHELIQSKARGKSGPLFHFDVHDDVRATGDARVEKDEAHAGKVLERHWYDKNKHIFPASRWEVYDPKKDYGGYTIHGGEIN